MEPARKGREHEDQRLRLRRRLRRAAMEPARKGREHAYASANDFNKPLPAAMEPARKGREHAGGPRGDRPRLHGRNGARPERAGAPDQAAPSVTVYRPQWSPPGKGGSTRINVYDYDDDYDGPQWSPPGKGGSTPTPQRTTSISRCRPQWSPPGKGGSTPAARVVIGPGCMAAMEPARKGREHRTRPPRQSPSTGRNGARPERAGARGSTSTTTTTTTTGRAGARTARAGARLRLSE